MLCLLDLSNGSMNGQIDFCTIVIMAGEGCDLYFGRSIKVYILFRYTGPAFCIMPPFKVHTSLAMSQDDTSERALVCISFRKGQARQMEGVRQR